MRNLLIVTNPKNWSLHIPGVEVVAAREYLTNPQYSKLKRTKIFNLCRSYSYQSVGYYVSLLAEARGHKPLPGVMAIQDIKSKTMVRFIFEELDELIQKSLKEIQSQQFTLSVYFGRNVAKRYDRLSQQLFQQFQAPLLRAYFIKSKSGWVLQSINPIPSGEIPEDHRAFVIDRAKEFFEGRRSVIAKKDDTRFDLAILRDPEELFPPSDEKAIQRFIKAAERLDFYVETIGKEDYGRIAEFDALFIRETTNVNHHTYRFARRAAAEGLVVIDDPESILRCTNKVYLAEVLQQNNIPAPKTIIVSSETRNKIKEELGLPCILKQPDSSFSQGVVKVETEDELSHALTRLFAGSDLLIAQEFLPTEFDWRIGILNRKPLYACKYFMARKHWQIYERDGKGRTFAGRAETLHIDDVPESVTETALKAANLIGNGLYGVDIKQKDGKVYVIEVNDNPSIDSGCEDEVLNDELYRLIMSEFLNRIEQKKERVSSNRK